MPQLKSNHEFLEDKPLRFVLDLPRPENPEKWEGWLSYKAELRNDFERRHEAF